MVNLNGEQIHRAAGVLLTMAAGDALGAGYEFGGPYPADMPVEMIGGGGFGWAPGEWTDDTQMALVIADAALAGVLISRATAARGNSASPLAVDGSADATADAPDDSDAPAAPAAPDASADANPAAPDDLDYATTVAAAGDAPTDVTTDALALAVDVPTDSAAGTTIGSTTIDDLMATATLDRIVAGWVRWSVGAADVGNQTRAVLGALRGAAQLTAAALLAESADLHARTGHTAGNGSLMRTAPVALAHLHDPDALTEAATAISQLTHFDTEAAEACVLWCHLIAHAILTGELDEQQALAYLPADRAAVWAERLTTATTMNPAQFTANGWVVQALQAAWCAITTTGDPADGDATHVRRALEAAVRGGRDTDTVAAIAGALLGALYGASAVPARWRRLLHGWPGLRSRDLITRAVLLATGGVGDASGWPLSPHVDYSGFPGTDAAAGHPHDDQVLLGGIDQLTDLPDQVDAVVSLCRLGDAQLPNSVDAADHIEVWLVDTTDSAANPHLEFVLTDTAEVLAQLRAEGKTVLLHCVQAQSRTPTVAALHAVGRGVTLRQALAQIGAALPDAAPNAAFTAALHRLAASR